MVAMGYWALLLLSVALLAASIWCGLKGLRLVRDRTPADLDELRASRAGNSRRTRGVVYLGAACGLVTAGMLAAAVVVLALATS